jgi:hypothetical protein
MVLLRRRQEVLGPGEGVRVPRDRRGLVFESLGVAEMEVVKGIPAASRVTGGSVALVVAFSQCKVVMRMKVRTRAGN